MNDPKKQAKEPRDAMRVFGTDTAATLDAAARLGGDGGRLDRERAYLLRALRALLGEYGDEADATYRSLRLKGSGVTIVVKAKPDRSAVGMILLEYGEARRGRERDAKYMQENGTWNVQRVAARAFLLHERWLTEQREKLTAEQRREAARCAFLEAYNEHALKPIDRSSGATGYGGMEEPTGDGVVSKVLSWAVEHTDESDSVHALVVKMSVKGGALRRVLRALREI